MKMKPATTSVSPKGRSAGFTLIEMIAVLLIAGVIMGITVPKVSTALETQSVHAAAREFAAMHSLAKATAMQHGRVARLSIDPSSRSIHVVVDTNSSATGAIDTVKVATLQDVAVTSDRPVLCFDRRGLATTNGSCDPGDAVVVFQWSPETCSGCAGVSDTVTTSVLGKILR